MMLRVPTAGKPRRGVTRDDVAKRLGVSQHRAGDILAAAGTKILGMEERYNTLGVRYYKAVYADKAVARPLSRVARHAVWQQRILKVIGRKALSRDDLCRALGFGKDSPLKYLRELVRDGRLGVRMGTCIGMSGRRHAVPLYYRAPKGKGRTR